MRFASFAITVLALALPAFTQMTMPTTWDYTYDNPALPLTDVACSSGANGLLVRGYKTLGDLPSFPHLGSMYPLLWNSTLCGTCWDVTYKGKTVPCLAIDFARKGMNIAYATMYDLGGQEAIDKGTIETMPKQVDPSKCGMPSG